MLSRPRWIPALVLLTLGALLAYFYLWFAPLKSGMHWDEVNRYAFPGVSQLEYSVGEIFAPLATPGEKGPLIATSLRLIRNLVPRNADVNVVFWIYKSLVLALNLAVFWRVAVYFFPGADGRTRRWGLFLLAILMPELWIQSNEVMTEPLTLPLALLFFVEVGLALDRGGVGTKGRFAALVLLFLALLFTSVQFFGACFVCAAIAAGLACGLERRPRFLLRLSGYFGGAAALAFAIWVLVYCRASLSTTIEIVKSLLGDAGQDYSSLKVGMNALDVWLFGWRDLFWLYLPSPAIVLPFFFLRRRDWREVLKAQAFWGLLAAVLMVVFAYGYFGNVQDRYRYIPCVVAAFFVGFLFVEGMKRMWTRAWGRALAVAAGLGVLASTALALNDAPCFGNLQVFGPYVGDRANCARGLHLTSFPHGAYAFKFKNADQVARRPVTEVRDVMEVIQRELVPEACPVAYYENPNYLTSASLGLLYQERFRRLPPCEGKTFLQVISVSLPEGSRWNSVSYDLLEGHSDAKAQAAWSRDFGSGGKVLLRDADFVVRMAVGRAR